MSRKSHLPRSVLAIKEAVEAAEAAGSPPANTDPTPTPNDPPAEPTPSPQPASEPQDGQPTPATGEQSLSAVIADRDTWKHKYDVLQGMHNRLSDENRDLREDVANLTRALSERSAQPAPQPSQPDLPRDEEAESILGADALAAIDRRVNAMVGKAVAPVAAAAQKSAVERFKAKVAETVSDWESVERTDAFQSYMNEVHPETGRPRGENLQEAIRAGDAARTALIYQNAKQALGLTKPAAGASTASTVKPLSERVAPSGAGAASTPATANAKVYSRAELTNGYTEIAKVKASGLMHGKTREKWEAWERDVVAAQAQGRIRA